MPPTSVIREDAKTVLKTISLENLIDGFPAWWRTFASIARHPFHFATALQLDESTVLRPAVRYALYSILVVFVLTAPIFLVHHAKMNKILYLARMCTQATIYGILMHYSLRILGAKRTLSASLASYFYLASTFAQLYLVIMLPWLIRLGPDAVFGGWSEAVQLQGQMGQMLNVGLVLVYLFCCIAAYYLNLRWFEITHHVRKRRIFVATMVSGLAGGVAQLILVVPAFQLLERIFGGFLDMF